MTDSRTAEAVLSPADADASKSTDAQLEADLARYLVLQACASELNVLKKKLKPIFEGTAAITIGRFTVTGKYVSQPEKRIPECTYWDMRVKASVAHLLDIAEEKPA